MITLGVLSDLPGIRHGFMTRAGGVSEGIYDSLNCGLGSDDEQARVLENRRRVLQMTGIPAKILLTAYQVHSPDVLVVEEEWRDGPRPKVDALVTTRKNIAIAASSAACVPISGALRCRNGVGKVRPGPPQATRAMGADHAASRRRGLDLPGRERGEVLRCSPPGAEARARLWCAPGSRI